MERLDTKRCYVILGLEPNATPAQLKGAYYELVRQWHPDRVAHNPKLHAIAEEELKNINAAYEFLKNSSLGNVGSSSQSQSRTKANKNKQEHEKPEQQKQEARQEQERQDWEKKRQDREAERLRVQQETEAAYQREQLAQAIEEAKRKEQEAKRIQARQTSVQSSFSKSTFHTVQQNKVEYTDQPCTCPGCPRKRTTTSNFCKWHSNLEDGNRNQKQGNVSADAKRTKLVITDEPCQHRGCPRNRTISSVFCKWHYLESVERSKKGQ